jgi:hypothetical protein
MGRAGNTHEGEVKYMQDFGRKTRKKETTRYTHT